MGGSFFFVCITTHLTDNSYRIKQTRIGIISIQISDSTMSHNGVKIQDRSIELSADVWLVSWETSFLRLCIFLPSPRSLCSHLSFSSRKHILLFFQHVFCSKGMFIFLTGGRRHDGIWEKKAPHLLGQMFDAFEQYCWSNLPWGSLVTDGLQMQVNRKEKRGRETQGRWREREKVCHYFPWAMKRDADFLKRNLVSSLQLFERWDFVCSWWSVIL